MLELLSLHIRQEADRYRAGLQTRSIIHDVEELAVKKGYAFQRQDKDKVLYLISEFMTEGLIGWGLNYDNPEPPFMHISEYGRAVVLSQKPQPYDPDGYLANLKTEIPGIDETIMIYITEALQTLRRNNLFSAAVMTGVASERAFELLLDAVSNAVTGNGQPEKFEKLKNDTRTKYKFDEVKKVVMQLPVQRRNEIDENLESNLDGVFNLIRITRNDAGHPTGKKVRREDVLVNLSVFVPYCKCIYRLIGHLEKNPI
ncbi:hypothetical protein NTE_02104 [Candidatus Nitrososphaera evergladensis SR1]|uniref:Uncharacterized protein n=2 Tax=Nitrososphaera TaxID=497726 RepID=A0A075MY00_9ARCH|nr:hypothetical protein NTE_02104 [Candidatus Nitrososphaera evergladensis SR1]